MSATATTSQPSVLFVGESPPPEAPKDFRPFDCASGTRLARHVLGLVDRAALLAHVPRANVFDEPTGPAGCPPWNPEAARSRAAGHMLAFLLGGPSVRASDGRGPAIRAYVLLGAKVADAFNLGYLALPVGTSVSTDAPGGPLYFLRLPHPSGASTAMNDPAAVRACRAAALPELVLGCPTLRPWHFRLDDPAVLADLAAAVSPHDPAVGAAALLYAAEQHRLASAERSSPLLAAARALTPADPSAPDHPWDAPLLALARVLLRPDGPRELASAWWPARQRGRLTVAAKARRPNIESATISGIRTAACRAAVLRYALAGVA